MAKGDGEEEFFAGSGHTDVAEASFLFNAGTFTIFDCTSMGQHVLFHTGYEDGIVLEAFGAVEGDQSYPVVVDGIGRVVRLGHLGLECDFGEEVLQGGLLVGYLKIGGDTDKFLHIVHAFDFVFVLSEHIFVSGFVVD